MAGFELLGQGGGGEGEGVFGAESTPSTPWHRMEDPAVQMFGLINFTLLRRKLLLPWLEILSMYSAAELGIMEPVGIYSRWSKSRGDGIEWWSKKSVTESCVIVIFDSIRSLGIKKVTFF